MNFKSKINTGDVEAIRSAVQKYPELANKIIRWGPLLKNKVHPLQYLCDKVFVGKLNAPISGEIAQCLIDHGANINGYGFEEMKDTPLIAAASLHADEVALVLIEAGADIHHAGCFGGTALHWAAWCGRDKVVTRLLQEDIDLDRRCITHLSTAFFWAAHGRANGGENNLHHQVECARLLKEAGADTSIPNINDITASELLKDDEKFMSIFRT